MAEPFVLLASLYFTRSFEFAPPAPLTYFPAKLAISSAESARLP